MRANESVKSVTALASAESDVHSIIADERDSW